MLHGEPSSPRWSRQSRDQTQTAAELVFSGYSGELFSLPEPAVVSYLSRLIPNCLASELWRRFSAILRKIQPKGSLLNAYNRPSAHRRLNILLNEPRPAYPASKVRAPRVRSRISYAVFCLKKKKYMRVSCA